VTDHLDARQFISTLLERADQQLSRDVGRPFVVDQNTARPSLRWDPPREHNRREAEILALQRAGLSARGVTLCEASDGRCIEIAFWRNAPKFERIEETCDPAALDSDRQLARAVQAVYDHLATGEHKPIAGADA